MENKKVYSLSESRNTLNSISKDLMNMQMPLAFEEEQLLSDIRNKYGVECDSNAHITIEIDLAKDQLELKKTLSVVDSSNKKFIDYTGRMTIILTSFHTSNYLIMADCIVADEPKLERKNIKFSFLNRDDILVLIGLSNELGSVTVNVKSINDPAVIIYQIQNIVDVPDDLFDSSICNRCPIQPN